MFQDFQDFCFPYENPLTWPDILFEKLRPEIRGWIWKKPFALRYPTLGGVDSSAILLEFRYLPISAAFGVKRILWY